MSRPLSNPAPGFRVTATYGPRKPIDLDGDGIGDTAGFHGGLDLGSLHGGPKAIVAAAPGIVVAPPYDKSAGIAVCILHPDLNLWTGYAHLSTRATTIGQHVERGQYLGLEGATGKADGAHLHFDVGIGMPSDFRRVDPLDYLDLSTKASAPAEAKPPAPRKGMPRMFLIELPKGDERVIFVKPGSAHHVTPQQLPQVRRTLTHLGLPTETLKVNHTEAYDIISAYRSNNA